MNGHMCNVPRFTEHGRQQITTQSRKTERKEVLLEEHAPVWFELRDLHFGDASLRLHDKMSQFGLKNKAAQIRLGRCVKDIYFF